MFEIIEFFYDKYENKNEELLIKFDAYQAISKVKKAFLNFDPIAKLGNHYRIEKQQSRIKLSCDKNVTAYISAINMF